MSVGVANLFILHGIVLDKLSVKDAGKVSGELIRTNWKDYLKQNLLFLVVIVAALGIVVLVMLVLPLAIVYALPISAATTRILTVFLILIGCTISMLASLIATPIYLMKMTQLYYSYKKGEPQEYAVRESKKHPVVLTATVTALVVLVALSVWMDDHFDDLFLGETKTQIIAHRGGGNEGPENTVAGIETACAAGAYGTEINIQRTKDGAYVLFHDGAFLRVAGDPRKPEDMTLDEIKSQRHFLCSNADGLITDNVTQAVGIQKELEQRSDLQRMVDRIMTIVS